MNNLITEALLVMTEELGSENEWGTPELTNKFKKATPYSEAQLKKSKERSTHSESIDQKDAIRLKAADKLIVKSGQVFVNGKAFNLTEPEEMLDWPKSVNEKGELITWFKGRQSMENTWPIEDIEGYYAEDAITEAEENKPELKKYVILVTAKDSRNEKPEKRNELVFKKYTISAQNESEAAQKAKIKAQDAGYSVQKIENKGLAPVSESNVDQDEIDDIFDIEDLEDLYRWPDAEFANEHYGSVERYRAMLRGKIDKLKGK